MNGLRALLALGLACVALPLAAADAAPVIADAETEARFNRVAGELRCLVCQNQTIADSKSGLAEDLRREILDMIGQGKSDAEIRRFMVERYGDFILYRPPVKPTTLVLWLAPFAALGGGTLAWWLILRRRRPDAEADAPLSDDEAARLAALYCNHPSRREP